MIYRFTLYTFFMASLVTFSCKKNDNSTIDDPVPDEDTTAVDTTTVDTTVTSPPETEPLFTNSIVSTDIDFIQAGDADAFDAITYLGQEDKEMPDSRTEELFDTDTYIFNVDFTDGSSTEIWAHSDFGSVAAAQEYADKLTGRLGKLPDFMRETLSHVVLHFGDAGAYAESEAQFFVIYSDNMDVRISNNDLEETVFHESVHATLDELHLETAAWLAAQEDDGNFITDYAEANFDKEDLAESALFVYTMLKHPGRLSADIENWVNTHIPNRFEYIEAIFE